MDGIHYRGMFVVCVNKNSESVTHMNVFFHVPHIHIPHPYYLYVGQMEPFPTFRSHDLETFLACIRPHVRIYVSHFVVNTYISVCMPREVLNALPRLPCGSHKRQFVNSRTSYVYLVNSMIFTNFRLQTPIIFCIHIPTPYIHESPDVENTRCHLRTHVRKLPNVI